MKCSKMLLIAFFSCTPVISFAQACDSLNSLEWILGGWVADQGKNVVTESWKKVSPLTFEAWSETRSKASSKPPFRETMRLLDMSDEIFYLAKTPQNERPVAFTLTECSDSMAVFEKTSHDFPKKIEYVLIDANKLAVTVSDGKDNGFKIDFKKVN